MCSHAKINACTFFVIQMYVWRTATSEQQTPVALLYTKYKLLVHPQQTQTTSTHVCVQYIHRYIHTPDSRFGNHTGRTQKSSPTYVKKSRGLALRRDLCSYCCYIYLMHIRATPQQLYVYWNGVEFDRILPFLGNT